MRVAFLLSVLLAAGLLGLLERYWRPLAWRLGKGYRLLRPALSLLSLGIFAKIASEVQEQETSSLDRAVSLAFRRLDSPVMDVIVRLFTALGSFAGLPRRALVHRRTGGFCRGSVRAACRDERPGATDRIGEAERNSAGARP